MRERPVLFFAAQLLPEAQAAIAVRCHHLIAALRDAGIAVDVRTHSNVPSSLRLLFPLPSNRLPVPVRMLGEAAVGVEMAVRLTLGWFRGRRPLVVLSSPPYVACTIMALACRALRLPHVWDARDLYPEVLEHMGVVARGGRIASTLRAVMGSLYRSAAFVSTPSDSFGRQVLGYGVQESCVLVIRNGFDEQLFVPGDGGTGETFLCINHGLLGRIHDIELLLEVARRLAPLEPRVRIRIIGHGPKQQLLQGDLPANVEYVGPMAYETIPAALAAADLGLAFIVDSEGADGAFPVKVYECWGAGLPVIVTPFSEAGRLVTERGMGLAFRNVEVDALVSAIRRLASRGAEYQGLRASVLRERRHFGRRAECQRFAQRVRMVLSSPSARA